MMKIINCLLYFVGNIPGHVFCHYDNFIVVCHLFEQPSYLEYASKHVAYKQELEYSMTHQERNWMNRVTIECWMKLCIDFLLSNFLEPGKPYFAEWTVFPPVYRELNLDDTKKIAMLFYNSLSSFTSGGLIIIGYDSYLHAKFILTTTTTDYNRNFRNRILIFHAAERVLFNVRITSSHNVHDLYAAWMDCSQDIKDFIYINGKRYFINSDIIILGVVAALNVDKDQIGANFCLQCNPFLLTSKELHNQETLAHWLKVTLPETLASIREGNQSLSSSNQTRCIFQIFKELASTVIGYMANIRLRVSSGPNDIHTAIQNIQLNNSQIQAYLSPKQHVVIKGSYGTGKSVIAQLHLERLAHEGGIIYYILFDPFSMMECSVRNTANKLEEKENMESLHIRVVNLATIAEEFGFSELPPLSKVISSIHKKHGDVPFQIIVDEFDGQTLDRYEAENIKEELKLLPNNFVLIVAQAYENERMFIQKGKTGIKQKRFQYHMTQMEVIELRKTMRNSVSINNLLSVAVSTINETASEFLHPIIVENKAVLKKTTLQESTYLRVKRFFTRERSGEETSRSSTYDDSYPTQSSTSVVAEEKNESSHKDDAFPNNKVEMDTIFALLSQSNLQCSSEKTITWSKYIKNDGSGHNYIGPKPFLIYPPQKSELIKTLNKLKYSNITDEHLNILRLLICFNTFFTTSPKVIICNYVKEFYLFANSLSMLGIPYNDCAYDFGESTVSKLKEHINCNSKHIITSRRSFRGMEAQSVVLPVFYHDEFGRQYTIENIARTTVELSMIVLDEQFKSSKGSIFGKVIDEWTSNNLVDIKKISCSSVTKETLAHWMNTLQGMELQKPSLKRGEIELVERY